MTAAILALAMGLPPKDLHVEGNRLVDNGQTVVLKGVTVPSFESSTRGEYVFRSARVAIEDWGANCIRIPVSQDRWLGRTDEQKDKGGEYKENISEVIDFVTARGAYAVLDLASSDAGVLSKNLGQHSMPDKNSLTFWDDAARRYKKNPHVLYDLYDAPHDVTWPVWLNGGEVVEKDLTYSAIGLRNLLNVVRKTGAKNVVIVGGLDSAYDLTPFKDGAAPGAFGSNGNLSDPGGNGLMLDAHLNPTRQDWDRFVGEAAKSYPVMIGELRIDPESPQEPAAWAPKAFDWISERNLSWTASSFSPTAPSNLIKNWKYEPTEWGDLVKKALSTSPPPPRPRCGRWPTQGL